MFLVVIIAVKGYGNRPTCAVTFSVTSSILLLRWTSLDAGSTVLHEVVDHVMQICEN